MFTFSHIFLYLLLFIKSNYKMVQQAKHLTIRLSDELSDNYKKMCDQNGYTLSKRLRSLLECDIKLSEQGINLISSVQKDLKNEK